MSWRILLLALVACFAAGAATAEVRVVRDPAGQLRLFVQPVAAGIWAPRGVIDAATVNPLGDLVGDGYPAAAVSGDGDLLAAWHRAQDDSLVILRAHAGGARVFTRLASGSLIGRPSVTPVGDNWLVTWSSIDGGPRVLASLETSGQDGAPLEILPGRLVAVVAVGEAVHVLSHAATTDELYIGTYVGLHDPDPIPVPISVTRVDLRLHEPDPRPIPIDRATAQTTAWAPCIENGETQALVAWRAVDRQVGSIVLDEFGVLDDAEFVRGPAGSCTAVLKAAGREREGWNP